MNTLAMTKIIFHVISSNYIFVNFRNETSAYLSSHSHGVHIANIHRPLKARVIPPAAIRYVGTAKLQSS